MMPSTFKPSRSRILSTLFLCLFLYLTYRYMFPSEPDSTIKEIKVPVNSFKNEAKVDGDDTDAQQLNVITPVKVTVFYECLCPDSRSFFLHHLVPAYEKAPNLVDIEFVPYGNAKTFIENGHYKFSCQHGPPECYGNKIHACAVEQVTDPKLRLQVTTCMIDDNVNPDVRGAECSEKYGIPWKPILECALSKEGDLLLKQHGDATHALQPPVTFIPTILLNESQGNQAAILKNLWKEICNQYPEPSKPRECLS